MSKKFKLSLLMLTCINLLCGCKNKKNEVEIESDNLTLDYYTVKSDYDFNNALEDGFVIYGTDDIQNESFIYTFYNHYLTNKEDTLTVLQFTTEGDPIIFQYVYRDSHLIVYEDFTRDAYSASKEIKVKELKTIEIIKDEYKRPLIVEKYL